MFSLRTIIPANLLLRLLQTMNPRHCFLPRRLTSRRPWIRRGELAPVFALAIVAIIFSSGSLLGQEDAVAAKPSPVSAAPSEKPLTAAIEAARERAEMLHEIYSATLVVMHRHYFHSDVAVVPARAMEDIFEAAEGLYRDQARWISVNTKAMSLDHKPSTVFEKEAAAQLAAGKNQYELVENGVYQRAAVIRLGTSCVGCHVGRFSQPPKSPRAGLVISIPLPQK